MLSLRDRAIANAVGATIHRWPFRRGRGAIFSLLSKGMAGRIVRSVYGVYLVADFRDATNRFSVEGYIGDAVPSFIERLGSGDCFIDVGANQGLFSVLAALRVGPSGQVVAFEPQLSLAHRLQQNAALNDVQVLCVPYAISETYAALRLSSVPHHSGVAHISNEGSFVSAGPMPSEIVRQIGERPVFVKIDCEGYELSVLRGLTPLFQHANVRALVIEIDAETLSRFGHEPAQIYAHLKELGFEASGAPRRGHYDEVFERAA